MQQTRSISLASWLMLSSHIRRCFTLSSLSSSFLYHTSSEQVERKNATPHCCSQFYSFSQFRRDRVLFLSTLTSRSLISSKFSRMNFIPLTSVSSDSNHQYSFRRSLFTRSKKIKKIELEDHSQRAVTTALCCNFLVFSLKFGVWLSTSSHVMLAEVVHSVADFANQALLAYGLNSSKRAPDAIHPYGYSKERFVWSLVCWYLLSWFWCYNCSWSTKLVDHPAPREYKVCSLGAGWFFRH